MCAAILYLNAACESFFFNTGDGVVVCVNNLGALSALEMAVITRAAIVCLGNYGLIHLISSLSSIPPQVCVDLSLMVNISEDVVECDCRLLW